jgi:tripeptide aminopeptidase
LINKKRLLKTFIKLVSIKSPSKDEKEIAGYVKNKLSELGLKVKIDRSGKKFGSNAGNIVAYYKAKKLSGSKPIFLTAHLDTVKVEGDIKPVIRNGKIYNKDKDTILGGDDKIAVAAIIEVLSVITQKNIPTGDIYIIFTVSEEIGVMGAKNLDMGMIGAKYGFAFDSDGDVGTIINQAPFHNSIVANFKGKATHAGIEPEKGINAIKAASIAIANMKTGRIDKESTSNIGKIEGGVATNIVAENTKVEMEARSLKLSKLNSITKKMVNDLKKGARKTGAGLEYKVVREYEGFKIKSGEIPMKVAKNALIDLNIKPKIMSSGGGSDINIFNSKGKMAVNLSAGLENIHTAKEFVKIDQLEKLAKLILNICKTVIR